MTFLRTGLPNRVSVVQRTAIGTDDEDNPQFTTSIVLERPARFYRDEGREQIGTSDGIIVTGMVTFGADATDTLDLFTPKAEILIHDGQFPEAGARHQVVHPTLQMTWSKPSHWEISVGRTR